MHGSRGKQGFIFYISKYAGKYVKYVSKKVVIYS